MSDGDGHDDRDDDPAVAAPGGRGSSSRTARLRHLLVTDVEEGRRLAWHWWRNDGELSAVEITVESIVDGTTVVRVVETLAVASSAPVARAGGAGRAPRWRGARGID